MTPPDGLQTYIQYLGIEPWRIPIVILSAIGIYLAFLILVRVFGVRVLTGWNGFDAVIIIMFGAVAGRVIIGHPPTLTSGIIGLGTLMLLEMIFGQAQQVTGIRSMKAHSRVIITHGQFIQKNLRRSHLTQEEVYSALRRAGIAHLDQVQCVILEATGALSVIREGTHIDRRILEGVIDADTI